MSFDLTTREIAVLKVLFEHPDFTPMTMPRHLRKINSQELYGSARHFKTVFAILRSKSGAKDRSDLVEFARQFLASNG